MTLRDDILHRFRGAAAGSPLYLPNLTLWYDWHAQRGTLPAGWQGLSLAEIARRLGVPAWLTVRPFRVDPGNVEIVKTESAGERIVRYCAPSGTLIERWTLGPDGDWWETEYPVKTQDDLRIAEEILKIRTYVLEPDKLERLRESVSEDGLVALELPRRPFSQIFLEWLGWGDGLMLFFDSQDLVEEIVTLLEDRLQALVEHVALLPGDLVVSPDNLDAQFISPAFFKRYLAASYRRSADLLHAGPEPKSLVAGTGGPIRRLLAPLAAAGIDGLEGISGPPQSDATLSEARQQTGPAFTLWGGIPQDALLADFDYSQFEKIVVQAAREAVHDNRSILGIADCVPVDADLARLQIIPSLIQQSLR